jgi:hypothetical protein
MTARCALAKYLLSGNVLNIKNCFEEIGLTNAPREISRMIEKPFGVEVSRTPMTGKNRFGSPINWYNYRLNSTAYNKEGIDKMIQFVKENEK